MFIDEFGAYGAGALDELGRYAEALEWLEPVTPVHVTLTFPDDPLAKVRALAKAYRAGLKASSRRHALALTNIERKRHGSLQVSHGSIGKLPEPPFQEPGHSRQTLDVIEERQPRK